METRGKSKKIKTRNAIIKPFFKIISPMLILYIIFKYKPLILIIIFEIFDLTKLLILRKKFTQFPLDLVFVFGITAAYYCNFLVAIIIFVLGIINRLEVAHIKDRHVTKCIRHFTLFFLSSLLNSYSFFTLATFLQLLNYLVKYGLSMRKSDSVIFEKSIYHVFNFISSVILFYFIEVLVQYFPNLI